MLSSIVCHFDNTFSFFIIFRFSLDRHTDLDRIFNIHSGNGSIYTSKPLDREISQWHNLSVIAAEISKPIWSLFSFQFSLACKVTAVTS